MNELAKEPKWYTIEELAAMCGISVETLKHGSTNLSVIMRNMSINLEVNARLGGYHNTKKYYSENVLKALKEYQLKNYVPNALKDKETAVMGNVSFVQQATVKQTINNLLDNPDTLNLLLQESIARNKALGIENKQLKEVLKEKTAIVNRIADGQGCFTMNQTAKALKLPYGHIKLYEKLRGMQILNHDNSPKQEHINNGHFKVIVKHINDSVGSKPVTITTSKGLVYLAKKFNTEIDTSVLSDA